MCLIFGTHLSCIQLSRCSLNLLYSCKFDLKIDLYELNIKVLLSFPSEHGTESIEFEIQLYFGEETSRQYNSKFQLALRT